MAKYVEGIKFHTIECCQCGMAFAMTDDFRDRRLEDHGWFYCPAGHQQHYTGKTEEQKLREQLEKETRESARLRQRNDEIQRRAAAVNKQYKHIRDRIKNGVCPCCTRTFQNLGNHMRTEHADWGNHDLLKALRKAFALSQVALAEEAWVSPAYVSMYENNKPVPAQAQEKIELWLSKQTA